ncbi:MAG: hypothetical protein PHP35_01560 [Candidatus Colwellbacteria bacterium]|nr:hypothetical protein [Candidatus Colwellbacteria bacterium]
MFWFSLISFGNVIFIIASILLSLSKNPYLSSATVVCAALIVKSRPGLDIDNLIFIAALSIGAVIGKLLPFRPRVNAAAGILISFTLLNLGLYLTG